MTILLDALHKRLTMFLALVSMASFVHAQTLIANYPLTVNNEDLTGNFGPITYGTTATPAPNACGDGSPTTGIITSPSIGSLLNISNFQVSMTFKTNSLATTSRRPIFMIDNSYRAFGVSHTNTGLIQLTYNNNKFVSSTTSIIVGQSYTLTAKYVAPWAEIYLNGELILSENIGSPLIFNSSNSSRLLCNYNGSNGQYGTSCWSNVKIYSEGVTLAIKASNITSTKANGTYKVGDIIPIQITFPVNVAVTGTPQLTLETGTTDRTASYASGSGTSTLTFNYTVQAGDQSTDLDYTSTTALGLNGGTIQDNNGNNINLAVPAPGTAGSLGNNKDIVIDGIAPTVSLSSTIGSSGTTTSNTSIPFTVTFTKNVTGFAQNDLTLTNATSTDFNGSGSEYTFKLLPTSNGPVTVNIAANRATDAAGNGNVAASTFNLNYQQVLPVDLISFSAKIANSAVQLTWKTTTEKNNRSFTVFRSSDGKAYSPILTIDGMGNSEIAQSYLAYDRSPLYGANYYQLAQTDVNGNISLLDVKTVNFELQPTATLAIAPNPANSKTMLSFPTGTQVVEILDITGKVVKKLQIKTNATSQEITLSELAPNTYFVRSRGIYGVLSSKLVKSQ